MESDIHLNLSAPVVFLKFQVVALLSSAGFLDLPSFARRMKSEKKIGWPKQWNPDVTILDITMFPV